MSAKRGLRIRGLRQRWLVNAVLPIVLVVIAIVTVYTLGVRRTYYSAMRSGLETRARVAADNFSSYSLKSYSEYFRYASITAETFEEKDRLELQFINVNGRVQVSSYGLTAGTQPGTSDVTEAVATGKPASFEGLDPQTGERILSVSAPLRFNGRVIGVLRYVTALHEADRSVLVSMAVAIGVALLCVGLAIFSNAIFINNVVEPVAVVSDAARRISAGSYGILIDNHYRDELGELVDNINDMSLKISQSEKIQQEFVSSVSHELRTPLTAINGWAETLAADPGANPEQTQRGAQHHRQGVPPSDHHGRGAAGLHPDAGRALHPARGGDRPARRAGGRHLHLPRDLQPGGHRAALRVRGRPASHHRRRRAHEAGLLQRTRQRRQARRQRQAHRRVRGG
ncbi:MAG: histidine kinase dimerization/phospho-acceptor domain-containing protein [Oscillospiraceae bacterium]